MARLRYNARMRRRAPILTWIAAFAVVGLVVAAAFYRDGIARHYYVWRLESAPELLGEFLEAPDGSLRSEAAQRFLTSAAGRTELTELFCRHMVREFDTMFVHRVPLTDSQEIGRVLVVLGEENVSIGTRTVAGGIGTEQSASPLFPDAHYRALREHLPEFPDEGRAWPDRPDLSVRFLPWRRFREVIGLKELAYERSLLPLDEIDMKSPEPNDPVCIIAPRGRGCVPALVAGLSLPLRMSRIRAARILGGLGAEATEAVSELKRLIAESDDEKLRAVFQETLDRIEAR